MEKYNSKTFAFTATLVWALAVIAYFVLMVFAINALAGLISVSSVISIIATNYYVKATAENKIKIEQNPLYNNQTDDKDGSEYIVE